MAKFSLTAIAVLLMLGTAGCGDDDDGAAMVDSPAALGSYLVGHQQYTVIDRARGDRSLPVQVWYPVEPGTETGSEHTFYDLAMGIGLDSERAYEGAPADERRRHPFLVFSHGYGGISLQSIDLMEFLASHGFVVASPEHTGNAQFSNTDDFDQAAANRVPDVAALIDDITERDADTGSPFYGRIDLDRIGVVGHSFGGMTAIGAAAGWAGASADPRVGAIVPISAVVDRELQSDERTSSNAGFTAAQLGAIEVPAMLVGGTLDVNVFPENNQIAFDQMVGAPRVYKLDIIGANHNHFANVCTFGELLIGLGLDQDSWPVVGAEALIEPFNTTCTGDAFSIDEVMRLQNLFVVSFFRRHLLGEAGYDEYLSVGYAATEPAVELAIR